MSRQVSENIVFVGKLSFRCREDELEQEFTKFGKIKGIEFLKNRGFAFIEFSHPKDAKEAVNAMDGRKFEGTRLVVQFKGSSPLIC